MTTWLPGCFGSPLCHRSAALPCLRCPYLEACGDEAAACAVVLREEYGIANVIEGRVRSGADAAPPKPATKSAALGPAARRRQARPRRGIR